MTNPWGQMFQSAQQMPTMGRGGWGANFGMSQATSPSLSENPHVQRQGLTPSFLGFSTAPGVSDSNVYASQGAGASGFSWDPNQRYLENLGSRSEQQAGMNQQAMQRQQDLARAAYMRATPTPGGMQAYGDQQAQRWQQMMSGLQGMQQPRSNRF